MALAVVGGAALGTVFGALYDVVKIAVRTNVTPYKPLLGDLKFTLDSLKPRIIQQIGEYNLLLGLPNDEIEGLQQQMEEGVKLVVKLSKLGTWNCYIWCSCCNCTRPSYADQIVELDRSLRILLELLKLQEARDLKEALLLARKIHDKQDQLDKRMSDLLKVQQEAGLSAQEERNLREILGSNNTQTMGQNRMEGSGVQGAALGAMFGVLYSVVIQVKDKTRMFKRVLGYLKSTLDSLKPLIEEIAGYNKVLHLPKDELENFRIQMEKGVELVNKSSKVRSWSSYKKYEYTSKLHGLDESLQGLLGILRVQLPRDVRESLVSVNNIETVIKRIEGCDVVENDQLVSTRWCPLPEPPWSTVQLNVLDVQATGDVIKETSVAERKIEEGVKLIEGSSVVRDQIVIKGSCKVVEPPLLAVELDVLNVQGTMDVMETSDLTTNMETRVMKIERSSEAQNQVDIALTEPPSPTVGLDVKSMLGTRDENETFVSEREATEKQIEVMGELQVPGAEFELPSLTLESDVPVGLLDMSTFKGNQQGMNREQKLFSDFSFQPETRPIFVFGRSSDMVSGEESLKTQRQQAWCFNKTSREADSSTVKTGVESEFEPLPGFSSDIGTSHDNMQYSEPDGAPDYIESSQSSQYVSRLKSDDGFNWRKYGQKPGKGGKYQCSYYKCTYPNCPAKKEVKRSLEGQITVTVKGSHNHPKPRFTRLSTTQPIQGISDQSVPRISNPKNESVTTQEDSSASSGEDNLEQEFPISNLGGSVDGSVPEAIRREEENADAQTFSASKVAKEHRVTFRTKSEMDILDDGFRWRLYGKKKVKGNLHQRNYYKCTFAGCPVRKHVERDSHDLRYLITTYEGQHNHDATAALGSGSWCSAANKPASDISSNSNISGQKNESFTVQEDSSASIGKIDFEQNFTISNSGGAQDENEHEAKRWKEETANDQTFSASGSSIVKEPRTVEQTSETDILDQGVVKGKPNLRKIMAESTSHVMRGSSENVMEDGHRWRKYGQKDILGAKHPRGYYRCAYRNVEGCRARKQVQRLDEDPTILEVTYRGKHTCSHGSNSVPPASSEQQEEKRTQVETSPLGTMG